MSTSEKPIFEPPEWLNHTFLESALREGLTCDDLKVEEYKIAMATSVGDNFASQIYRIQLSVKRRKDEKEAEKLSVIAKIELPGIMGEETKKWKAFEREGKALSKTLPLIYKNLNSVDPEENEFWAKCYYTGGPPTEIIIMEDLKPAGYSIGNRFEGFDMTHSKLVLQNLAKLHATSLNEKKKNPEAFDVFMNLLWSPESIESIKKFVKPPMKVFSEEILKWEEFKNKELYSEKFKKLEETVGERGLALWKRDDSKINVLLHGDSWVNNYMFKYDSEGNLSGIKFLDFQFSQWSSPVFDLHYFIFTSAAPHLRFDRINEFLKIYHDSFVATLEKLNDKTCYTFDDLKRDFDEKYLWGLIIFLTVYPIVTQPRDESSDPEDIFSEQKIANSFAKKIARDEIRQIFRRGLPFFEEKGVF